MGYFGSSLIWVYLAPLMKASKLKHAKISQTSKIKTLKSAIVNSNEPISQVQIAIMKRVHNTGIKVFSSVSFVQK